MGSNSVTNLPHERGNLPFNFCSGEFGNVPSNSCTGGTNYESKQTMNEIQFEF